MDNLTEKSLPPGSDKNKQDEQNKITANEISDEVLFE